MPNTILCVALSRDVRKALLGETDLSSAAVAAVERPFDDTLTVAIANELLAKCRKLQLSGAAEILETMATGLSARRIPVTALTAGAAESANGLSQAGSIGFIPQPIEPTKFSPSALTS